MKKRILLSLVSFFAMTAMWASLTDAYQIYVTAANGKTGATAELTLNMKNKNAIATWRCDLFLPEGVTFESVEAIEGRYPAEYAPEFQTVANADGSVTIVCEGEDGVTLNGNDGAVAKVTVKIDASVAPETYVVMVKNAKLTEAGQSATIHPGKEFELQWIIEQGEVGTKGDFNGDKKVDIADAVCVLDEMAAGTNREAYDLNNDGKVDIADFVLVLDMMAQQ